MSGPYFNPAARRFFDKVHQPCPVPEGTRVEITGVMDDPNPLPVGLQGEVVGGNGAQLWVRWDNGSSLALLVDEDPYRVVEAPGDGEGKGP